MLFRRISWTLVEIEVWLTMMDLCKQARTWKRLSLNVSFFRTYLFVIEAEKDRNERPLEGINKQTVKSNGGRQPSRMFGMIDCKDVVDAK